MLQLLSERLGIRPLGVDDIPAFVAYRRDPEIARFQSWDEAFTEADARSLVSGQPRSHVPIPGEWVQLGLHLREASSAPTEIVGDVAVGADAIQPMTFELGVTIARASQRQGYALEALGTVIEWLMDDIGAHRVVMQGDARNAAVLALMPRLGLRQEGSVVEGDWFKGEWTTLVRFALLDREWRGRERSSRAPFSRRAP